MMKRKRKFTQQLFITYSGMMLILLLIIFSGIFIAVYNDKAQNEISTQQEFISKTEQQIDTSLQNMDRIINGLLFNKSFMQIMKDNNIMSSYTKYSNEILDTIVSLDAPVFLSHRIIAFNADTYFTFTKTGEDQTHILNAIEDYTYYDQIVQASGEKVILPVHTDPFGIVDVPVYSVARTITDGRNVYGIIEVQNNYEQLESYCEADFQYGEITIMTKEGHVVYPLGEMENEGFLQELYSIISEKQESSGYFQWESNQISYSVSDYSQWITIMYCPLFYMLPDYSLVTVFVFSFIAALIVILGLIRIMTVKLTAPLSDFNQLINQISFDNLSMSLPQSYNIVEIENINLSFQAMLEQLRVEIARNAESRANEERANYIALQSQMNPHTIYNTITMIESVCYVNGDFEASGLCISFSQMLRYISDNQKSTYTIEDELQHLNNYAMLMKKRYEGRLLIETTVYPSLLSKVIPKFTLQPLVENSVKHGMNRNCQPFTVCVVIETTPTGWQIVVSDNGTGFTEEKIRGVYDQFAYCDACLADKKSDITKMKIDNMALNNIYIRWKILKGTDFQMLIENCAPAGCFIKLSVEEECHAEDLLG